MEEMEKVGVLMVLPVVPAARGGVRGRELGAARGEAKSVAGDLTAFSPASHSFVFSRIWHVSFDSFSLVGQYRKTMGIG